MAEKVILSEFDINVEQLIKNAAETKKRIDETKESLSNLNKEGKAASEEFVIGAVELRKLNKEYNAQLSVITKVKTENEKGLSIQQRIDSALRTESKSINELRNQVKELSELRNDVNITTEEGQKTLKLLNDQIDINNELIKENVDDLSQQKISIGDYADEIKKAFEETGIFNGALGDLEGIFSKLGPVFEKVKKESDDTMKSFKGLTAGTEGMTASQKAATIATNLTNASLKALKLALIATGIGAFVIILGSLAVYFKSSEEAGNKLSKLMGVLGAVFNKVLKVLEPLGEFVADVLIAAFDSLGRIATKTISLVSGGLKTLGFDQAAASVDRFNNSLSTTSKNAAALAKAQAELVKSEREAGLIRLQFQRDAEKQRQIRDDESKSINERIAANEKLGKVLDAQMKAELSNATQALLVANLRQSVEGETTDVLDAQAQAREALFDIEERIVGQQSEQLTNINSLKKEAIQQAADRAAKAKEQAQLEVELMNQELEYYITKEDQKGKTLQESLKIEENISNKRKAILDQELKNKLITQTEYNTEILRLDQDLAGRRAEIAVQNADRELSLLENRLELEEAATKKIGQNRIDQELQNAQVLRTERAQLAFIEYQQKLIDETAYQDKVLEINQQYSLREVELLKASDDLQKENKLKQAELDRESRLITLESISKDEFKLRALQIEQERERNLEAARVTYTDAAMLAQAILNINGQATLAQVQLEKESNKAKIESRIQTLEQVASIVGEETAIGKAAAAARTAMTTYEAAMNAYSSLAAIPIVGPALGAAAAIAVGIAGARNVAKIFSTDTSIPEANISSAKETTTSAQTVVAINAVPPFATGGLVTGGIPIQRSNGDNILATLKKGEVVLTESHQKALGGPGVFKALGVPGFASGGIAGSSSNMTAVQNMIIRQNDNQLAKVIGEAVLEGSKTGSQSGTRQGIVDSTTESYIQRLSQS